MGFVHAVKTCLRKYVSVTGRAPRSEYWYFVLFIYLVLLVASMVDLQLHSHLGAIVTALVLLPNLTALIRRLHDRDQSGLWALLLFVPLGNLLLVVWLCLKGTEGPNRFGADPLVAEPAALAAS